MSDIGFNSVTNTNDFGGGMNTFTIDLRDLGNEKLLTIIYKMFYIEEYYFMNRNLKVCISSENGTQADIEFCFKREKCGRYPYYLSGNGFFNDLIEGGADYDAAMQLEASVERYVQQALDDFRKKYDISAAIITTFRETEENTRPRAPRPVRINAGDIRIGATPIPIELLNSPRLNDTYAASYGPGYRYLTSDALENIDSNFNVLDERTKNLKDEIQRTDSAGLYLFWFLVIWNFILSGILVYHVLF